MKTIGLIGGMSWESSAEYYKIMNQYVKERLGGLHSAKCILYSVDFAEIEELQRAGKCDDAGTIIANSSVALEKAGAEMLIICTNTMHKLANFVTNATSLPLSHIADSTAQQVQTDKISKIGLLGTQFTMEQDFYKGRLVDKFALEVITPNRADRERVHRIIYDELCQGIISEVSKSEYIEIIAKLCADGAQGIILGCTEIELLIKPEDCAVPLYPTAQIHALAVVKMALD
jgi:aspartate racemase